MITLAAIVIPLIAAVACASARIARSAAAVSAAAVVGVGLYAFEMRPGGLRLLWAAPLGSSFSIGFDPVSAILASACAAVVLAAIASSRRTGDRRAYFALWSLALSSSCLVLAARDIALLFVGWEALVLCVALLVRGWGGEGRHDASLRLAVHGLVGSGLLLVALASIADARGTLDIDALAARPLAATAQLLPAMLFLAAFAPPLALFPFHLGVTRAYRAAPPVVAIALAGPFAASAGYAIVRVCVGLFPQGMSVAAPVLIALAVVGALYAAAIAVRQDDMRRGLAFVAMSQQNLAAAAVFVGTAASMRGAILILIANALAIAATLLAMSALARRTSSFLLSRAGGLRESAPRLAAVTTMAVLATIGVPGTAAFAGDILALSGAYERYPIATAAAAVAVALGAIWAATIVHRALDGPPLRPAPRDVRWSEALATIALVAAVVAVGVVPRAITDVITDDALPARVAPR